MVKLVAARSSYSLRRAYHASERRHLLNWGMCGRRRLGYVAVVMVKRTRARCGRAVFLLGLSLAWAALGAAFAVEGPAQAARPEEVRGVWMWSSAVQQDGAEAVAKQLAQHGINRVFFLVKGSSGRVCYPSKLAPVVDSSRDLLQEILTACHQRNIEVHAWYVFNGDNYWGRNHPQDAMYHAGKANAWDQGPYSKKDDLDKIPICPLSKGYRNYFKSLVREVMDGYGVDGIHLDYIRYGHLCYCFCPQHQAAAEAKGIQLAKVRDAIYQTFYAPKKQSDLYFKLYRTGNQDVRRWVNMREEEINSAVKDIRETVKAKNPSLVLSASFMPEGGELDDAYALCHYAQNYATAGSMLDYILPMTYWKTPQWVAQIAHNAEQKSHRPVYSGLWAVEKAAATKTKETDTDLPQPDSDKVPTLRLRENIQMLRAKGIKGFVLFQYSTMTDRLWKELP